MPEQTETPPETGSAPNRVSLLSAQLVALKAMLLASAQQMQACAAQVDSIALTMAIVQQLQQGPRPTAPETTDGLPRRPTFKTKEQREKEDKEQDEPVNLSELQDRIRQTGATPDA